MLTLVNDTKRKVQFYAAGCIPESGVIKGKSSVQVAAQGPVVPDVIFGVSPSGTGEPPVQVLDVPENATVTLSVTVRNGYESSS